MNWIPPEGHAILGKSNVDQVAVRLWCSRVFDPLLKMVSLSLDCNRTPFFPSKGNCHPFLSKEPIAFKWQAPCILRLHCIIYYYIINIKSSTSNSSLSPRDQWMLSFVECCCVAIIWHNGNSIMVCSGWFDKGVLASLRLFPVIDTETLIRVSDFQHDLEIIILIIIIIRTIGVVTWLNSRCGQIQKNSTLLLLFFFCKYVNWSLYCRITISSGLFFFFLFKIKRLIFFMFCCCTCWIITKKIPISIALYKIMINYIMEYQCIIYMLCVYGVFSI